MDKFPYFCMTGVVIGFVGTLIAALLTDDPYHSMWIKYLLTTGLSSFGLFLLWAMWSE